MYTKYANLDFLSPHIWGPSISTKVLLFIKRERERDSKLCSTGWSRTVTLSYSILHNFTLCRLCVHTCCVPMYASMHFNTTKRSHEWEATTSQLFNLKARQRRYTHTRDLLVRRRGNGLPRRPVAAWEIDWQAMSRNKAACMWAGGENKVRCDVYTLVSA